jgi:hypothetical protein
MQERSLGFASFFSHVRSPSEQPKEGTTEQPLLAPPRSAPPGCQLASRTEAQLPTVTSKFAATTQSWADVATSAQRYHTDPRASHDHRDVVDMPHRSTHTDHRKIYNFLLKLKGPLAAITQRLFAVSDANAHRHGWQVTITRGGFGRTYRDPRFDYLAECTTCNGRGRKARDTTCPPCDGTGRIVLDPAALPRQGRGQS